MPIFKDASFFVPEHGLQVEETHAAGDQLGVYVLFRYWWAWAVLHELAETVIHPDKPLVVWDLGCGCGYGSYILAEQHPQLKILAVDYDPRALEIANTQYTRENVLYLRGNFDAYGVDQIPLEYQRPDVIICFEVLEFLKHRELFLDAIVRRLQPEGVFLFATNHTGQERCQMSPAWDKHTLLYDTPTITRILKRHFSEVLAPYRANFPCREYKTEIDELLKSYTVGNNLFYCQESKKL